MNKRKKIFNLSIAVMTALLLVFSGFASGTGTQKGEVTVELGQRQYYEQDLTLKKETLYRLPKGSKMRIEEGATLYIDGEFQVEGELKNYGTIVVRQRVTPQGRQEVGQLDSRGHLSVSGTLKNYGTILVDNGTMENRPSGTIVNEGILRLVNNIPEVTVFSNQHRTTTSGGSTGGTVTNTKKGRIEVATEAGVGFRNSSDGMVDNQGVFAIADGAEARGKIEGNSPVRLMDVK